MSCIRMLSSQTTRTMLSCCVLRARPCYLKFELALGLSGDNRRTERQCIAGQTAVPSQNHLLGSPWGA